MKTTAEKIAEMLNHDGQQWTTDAGEHLEDFLERFGAKTEYSAREYLEDEPYEHRPVLGYSGSYIAGDPVRHEFPDGSCIVEIGEGWDFEGAAPFSWQCGK